MTMRKIDCHMHFWTLAMEKHYHLWMVPDLKVLYGDYSPKDALPLMQANNVQGVVLVSAASSIEETGYLLGMADGHDFIRGVVAWIDLLAPSAPDDIAAWARFLKLKGIRPYLQDLPEDDWILKPELDPSIRAIIDTGLRFDALIKPRHILNTVRFIERYPDLPVIVDHMAKPDVANAGFETWREHMEEFRDLEHVHCKVSGLVTEDGPDWTPDRIKPCLEAVFDIFGADRLVFGSDWPVVNLVANYNQWIATLEDALDVFTRADRQKIWAENGERFYGL
jgi:L-fuconolactonase